MNEMMQRLVARLRKPVDFGQETIGDKKYDMKSYFLDDTSILIDDRSRIAFIRAILEELREPTHNMTWNVAHDIYVEGIGPEQLDMFWKHMIDEALK